MWSGVDTRIASKRLSSFSNICRKSTYFFACLKRPAAASSVFSSTSQIATMFSPANSLRSPAAMPPVPTEAMFSFSLGDFEAATLRSLQTPNDRVTDAAEVVFRKVRR